MKKITILCLSLSIFLLFLLSSFSSVVYNERFYHNQYKKNNIPFNESTFKQQTTNLFGFFKGNYELTTGFFNEKEILHLQDVKVLINRTIKTYYFLLMFTVLFIVFIYRKYYNDFVKILSKSFIYSSTSLIILTIISFLLRNHFQSFFILFHKMSFSNNLWILDPLKDNLIRMFPLQFFVNITQYIFLRSLILSIIILAVGLYLNHSIKK